MVAICSLNSSASACFRLGTWRLDAGDLHLRCGAVTRSRQEAMRCDKETIARSRCDDLGELATLMLYALWRGVGMVRGVPIQPWKQPLLAVFRLRLVWAG